MLLHALLFFAFAFSPLILGFVFTTWKTYEVYKAFGGRAHSLSFHWLSYRWQNEWLRTNLGYQDPLKGAPSDVRALATRNLAKIKTTWALMVWWVILIVLAAITVPIVRGHLAGGA